MIDDPRVYAPNYNTAKGYIGQALNAINYIYMINGTKASDPGYWSSNIRVQLQAGLERHGNIVEHGIVTPISMSACSGSTPALGNPPLPTTWSGGTTSDNGAW
jgi:hypothetical protein